MPGDRVKPAPGVQGTPRISPTVFQFFTQYSTSYLRKHFHALRLSQQPLAGLADGRALIVCLNHPSWWDPLVCLALARHVFPERSHFAPIEAAALSKYKIFERIGFFGIEPGTAAGASRFIKVGSALLGGGASHALWVTVQGHFSDPRTRPLELRHGVGHLVHRSSNIAVLPLALEYPFWQEKYPEALARFGEPLLIDHGSDRVPREWSALIAERLVQAQDRLAADSIERCADAFETVLGGSAGIGGVYDLWRSLRARVRGERFIRAHGEDLTR